MSPRPARSLVAARGVTAAGLATFAATVGHGVGQRALPSAWVVALALVLAAPVCVALAGRRLSVPRLAAAVALSQLGFHLLLRLDFAGPIVLSATGHHALMPTGVAGTLPHDLDPAMGVGHALAAAATVLVLATGERSLEALVALVRRPFRALVGIAAPLVAPPVAAAGAFGIRPLLVPGGLERRRGPPARG